MSFPFVVGWKPVDVCMAEKEMTPDSYKIHLLLLKFLQDMTRCLKAPVQSFGIIKIVDLLMKSFCPCKLFQAAWVPQ